MVWDGRVVRITVHMELILSFWGTNYLAIPEGERGGW